MSEGLSVDKIKKALDKVKSENEADTIVVSRITNPVTAEVLIQVNIPLKYFQD